MNGGSSIRRERAWAAGTCALLLVIYVALAWTGIRGKSATFDEPLHLVAAHTVRHVGDFRINPEDPPLWQYWADLPHARGEIKPDYGGAVFAALLTDPTYHWRFTLEALYPPSGLDADAYLRKSRAMMVVVAVVLGAAIGAVAWKIGGPWAAAGAVALFALDPNFLGHGPLVKNDVTFSLAMFLLCAGLWSVGKRITWWNLAWVAVACAAGVTSKFSGVLMGPMVVLAMVARGMLPGTWRVGRRDVGGRGKAAVAGGVIVAVGLVSWAVVWGVYGFRFAATPDGRVIDTAGLARQVAINRVAARQEAISTPQGLQAIEDAAAHPPAMVRGVLWAEQNKLLPQAWLAGLLYTYMSSIVRSTYLLGEVRISGWWYYFPAAMAFKTPVATIAAIVAAAAWGMRRLKAESRNRKDGEDAGTAWAVAAFGVPWVVYLAAALTTNLNIGFRHVLPLYPAMFVLAGVALSYAVRRWGRRGIAVGAVLAAALAVETATGWPDYIAFFNAPSRAYGPYRLLGDSNLDWGQDLLQLKKWQEKNPDKVLYLCYFGSAPPGYYGLRYVPLPGGYQFEPAAEEIPMAPGVLAMSVTNLQGIYMPRGLARTYQQATNRMEVIDVLGGSIYLYAMPEGGLK